MPEATIQKAAAVFQGLSAPSRPLAIALDLGPGFAFIVPTPEQVEKNAGGGRLGEMTPP